MSSFHVGKNGSRRRLVEVSASQGCVFLPEVEKGGGPGGLGSGGLGRFDATSVPRFEVQVADGGGGSHSCLRVNARRLAGAADAMHGSRLLVPGEVGMERRPLSPNLGRPRHRFRPRRRLGSDLGPDLASASRAKRRGAHWSDHLRIDRPAIGCARLGRSPARRRHDGRDALISPRYRGAGMIAASSSPSASCPGQFRSTRPKLRRRPRQFLEVRG